MTMIRPSRRRCRDQAARGRARGYTLVLVLGFATLVTLTGVAVLESATSAVPLANNVAAAARARNLAASGVALASHYLRMPPTTVTVGNYWAGTTNLSIDGTTDTVTIAVLRSATDGAIYSITSTATARDSTGAVAATNTVTTQVVTPPPKTWTLARAFQANGNQTIPAAARFNGDVHVNGKITSNGRGNGMVTATGSITWNNPSGLTGLTPNVAAVTLPTVETTSWQNYIVHGVVYQSTTIAAGTLDSGAVTGAGGRSLTIVRDSSGAVSVVDPLGILLGGLGDTVSVVGSVLGLVGTSYTGPTVLSNSNAGGVIFVNGNVQVGSLTLIGTLVINGNLTVNNFGSLNIVPMPNWPALVVTGNVNLNGLSTATFNGPVYSGGNWTGSNLGLTVNGPMLVGSGSITALTTTLGAQFNATAAQSTVYDFSNSTVSPMTLLNWSE